MKLSRRHLLKSGSALGALAVAGCAPSSLPASAAPATVARDEDYWSSVAALYDQTEAITNLEGGYWGVMSQPVRERFIAHTLRLNREGSYYVRGALGDDMRAVYDRLSRFLGVPADELLLVRSASEALQILIGGYRLLEPGDGVLYADLDYSAMKTAMRWLEQRRGVDVIDIALPEPATRESVIAAYRDALEANPHVKMMLLTHVNNLTGLVHPVKDIIALAKSRGVDVILDSAHAIGQIDFDFANTGADFIGVNLHKWIGAPLGTGLIHIRRDRIPDIEPFMGEPGAPGDIRTRAHTGALHFAAHLTIPDALEFHESIGVKRKEARLRHLRNLWVREARQIAGVQILTPDDPSMVAGMTSFRLAGRTSTEANDTLVARLTREHRVFTVRRSGPAAGDCVRVTPTLFNSEDDVSRIVPALRALAR